MGKRRASKRMRWLMLSGLWLGGWPAALALGHRPHGLPAKALAAAELELTGRHPPYSGALTASTPAELRACEGHFGRELGRVLCPAMLAAHGGAEADDVEWSLLAALWQLGRHQLARAWQGSQASWQSLAVTLRPLVQDDPL